jgi:hypothetical protein
MALSNAMRMSISGLTSISLIGAVGAVLRMSSNSFGDSAFMITAATSPFVGLRSNKAMLSIWFLIAILFTHTAELHRDRGMSRIVRGDCQRASAGSGGGRIESNPHSLTLALRQGKCTSSTSQAESRA